MASSSSSSSSSSAQPSSSSTSGRWIWTHLKRWMVGKWQDNKGVVNPLNSSEPLPSSSDALPSSSEPLPSSSEPLPSSSEPRAYMYDVFLSFRSLDTQRGIVSHLYDRLQNNRGIKTFMDDPDLRRGGSISPTLLMAIEKSRFAIVVLSPNYASSPWCLDELAKICECMRNQNRILPVFYNVEPSDARHRKGSFEEAFKKHESSGRYTSDKVQLWKEALNKVASFSGWHTDSFRTDGELVETIVDYVRKRIQPCGIIQLLPTRDFEEFESRWDATKKVMEALTDDEVTAIGVYGMGGVGKTTLVKRVGSLAHENGVLNLVILASMSQTPSFKQIQHTLADQLDFKFQTETEITRAAELHEKIMSKTKILIILDDIWEMIDLSIIGIPSYEELKKCNSKVLFTTRRLHVCNTLESQTSIPLNILSEQESWKLFVKSAGRSFESPNFENVARKVAGECRGLPIALTVIARALRGKELEEWNKASRRLEKSQSPTVDDKLDAFECIKCSYEYLKDEDHKSCFLLCCLFPEDYEIEIQDLFRYMVGTKFYREAETMEEARGTFVSIVKYLKDSSLLLDAGNKGCVKMHDVIRDTAIHIATSERGFWVKAGIGLEDWPRRLDGGCTAISLMWNEINKLPEEELVCPRLQILLLNHNDVDEIPKSFIESLNELRVFDVSNTSISVLPHSFSLLTNLQALYLDDCHYLIDISIVGELKNLEILSVRECPLKELPREIEHLTNLRILDIISSTSLFDTNNMVVTIPCEVISKLHKLEELYMGYCEFERLGCEAEGRGEETKIGFGEIAGLSNLKRLYVGIPHHKCIPNDVEAKPEWDYFYIVIGGPIDHRFGDHDSRSLYLHRATINMLPDWFINAVANKLEKLEYEDFGGSLVMEYDRGRLHELKHLHAYGSGHDYRDESDDDGHEEWEESVNTTERVQELINTTERVQKGPVFEKLEKLYLEDLFDLKELWVGDLPPGSLVNLKVLHISDCVVKNVSKFVQRLPSLEEIALSRVKELEYVFGCEGSELKDSKLREVRLSYLKSMKSICSGPAPRVMFQSIKILTIDNCGLLQSLFAFDVAQCLSQLEYLHVAWCWSLERVIKEVKKEKMALPKLKNLILEELPKLYGASSSTVDIECPSLELVLVVNSPHLPFSISNSDLYKSSKSGNGFSPLASEYFGSTNPVQLNDIHALRRSTIYTYVTVASALGDKDVAEGEKAAERLGRSQIANPDDYGEASKCIKLSYDQLKDEDCKTEIELLESIVDFKCSKIYTVDFEVFEATKQAMDEVMKGLKDEKATVIGVYGAGGVGKTTMVKHVCVKVRNKGMFHHVISVVVSKSPDLRKIQGTLAEKLGLELVEETEIGRSRRLMQKIRRESRILIILDDMWGRIDLCNIGLPSYHELQRCNSKVLLITRAHNVLHAMGCQSNIHLDVLSEEDSRKLFMNSARLMPVELTKFYDVANSVARGCAGLPIVLIAVAKALRGKDKWMEAAGQLYEKPANPEYEKVVFNCIKLSYDYLASDDARSCFLLCCLFPEDYDIQIEDLLMYAMGTGLFQDSRTMQDARASAHSVVKYLRYCSLLLESERDGCVKMHDVVRDVAIRISSSENRQLFFVQAGCQLKEWPDMGAHQSYSGMTKQKEEYSAISLIRNKICKLPEKLVCPKLLILFLQSNVCLDEIPENFFQSLNVLRVLDLSQTRISLLPTSLALLINLHTLYLDGCLSIINLSLLGKLEKLEILCMRELPLLELPKEIGNLSNLRMLDITGEYVDIVPSEVISNLHRLEELYMQCNFADWKSEVGKTKVDEAGKENVAAFAELTSLSRLNILKVFISEANSLPKVVGVEPKWINFNICVSGSLSIREVSLEVSKRRREVSLVSNSSPIYTRALTLGTTIKDLPGWFINVVTTKAEKLQYFMCKELDNILVEYDHGRLHALKYLRVIGPSEKLEVLMNASARNEPVFQDLEELHLIQVDCLKKLCFGELPPESLCNLRLLKVKHCYELVGALLPSQLLQRLQNLEKLICEEMDELEYVFGSEGLSAEQIDMTELKIIRLKNLANLIKIWNGPVSCNIFQHLQSLVVSGCLELRNLFAADVAHFLLQLENLSIECCPILDSVIEASKETMDTNIIFPNLKILVLIKLPRLTRFYSSSEIAIECPLLEYLNVERCPQFSTDVQLNYQQHLNIVQRSSTIINQREV